MSGNHGDTGGLRRRWGRLLSRQGFAASVAKVAGGTALGQLVTIAITPVLTRLYPPADFGLLSVFAAILTLLGVITCGRYEMALPLPKEEDDAVNLLAVAAAIAVATSLVTLLAVWLAGDFFAHLLGQDTLRGYLWLLPVGMLSFGSYQIFNYWATRHQHFGRLARTRLTQRVGQAVIQLAGGFLHTGAWGLIIGQVAGQALGSSTLARATKPSWGKVHRTRMQQVARRYKNFPLYTLWQTFVTSLGWQLLPLLFVRFFGAAAAGQYQVAMRVLAMPSNFIGQAVAQVFYPRAARQQAEVQRESVERLTVALGLFGWLLFAWVGLVGPQLFAFVLGHPWREAGFYARILTPWLWLSFLSSPLSSFAFVRERQRTAMLLSFYEVALRVVALLAGVWTGSATWALGFYSAAGSIISVVYLTWILRLAGSSWRAVLRQIHRQGATAVLLVALLAVLELWLKGFPFFTIATVLLAADAFWIARVLRHQQVKKVSEKEDE